MMKVLTTSILLFFSLGLFAQENVLISFHCFNDAKLETEVEMLKFYIGEVHLLNGDSIVYADDSSHYLIDLKDSDDLSKGFDIPLGENVDFDAIEFTLGVDSSLNELGAFGGDLDPTSGMYWTWQAGYINFKLEGQVGDQDFDFHLGGFLGENRSDQKVRRPVFDREKVVIIFLLNDFLAAIDLEETSQIMSPSVKAVELMKLAAASFRSLK